MSMRSNEPLSRHIPRDVAPERLAPLWSGVRRQMVRNQQLRVAKAGAATAIVAGAVIVAARLLWPAAHRPVIDQARVEVRPPRFSPGLPAPEAEVIVPAAE